MWLRLLREWVFEPNCLNWFLKSLSVWVEYHFVFPRNLYLQHGPASLTFIYSQTLNITSWRIWTSFEWEKKLRVVSDVSWCHDLPRGPTVQLLIKELLENCCRRKMRIHYISSTRTSPITTLCRCRTANWQLRSDWESLAIQAVSNYAQSSHIVCQEEGLTCHPRSHKHRP